MLRGGISWRSLPHEYPPWQTVYDYFRRWRDDGTWERIAATLRERLRVKLGRDLTPSVAIIGKGADWIRQTLGWTVEVVKRPQRWVWLPEGAAPPPMPTGFQVLKRRWVVERTFALVGTLPSSEQGLRGAPGLGGSLNLSRHDQSPRPSVDPMTPFQTPSYTVSRALIRLQRCNWLRVGAAGSAGS